MDFILNYTFETVSGAIILYLLTSVSKQNKKYNATQAGVKALLRDRLISAMHKAKTQNFIYIHEHENIVNMYQEYLNLGGNGTIVKMMQEINNLPIKTNIN